MQTIQFEGRYIVYTINIKLLMTFFFFFRKNQSDYINCGQEHKISYNHKTYSFARS
jgi:hypothetical protein